MMIIIIIIIPRKAATSEKKNWFSGKIHFFLKKTLTTFGWPVQVIVFHLTFQKTHTFPVSVWLPSQYKGTVQRAIRNPEFQ